MRSQDFPDQSPAGLAVDFLQMLVGKAAQSGCELGPRGRRKAASLYNNGRHSSARRTHRLHSTSIDSRRSRRKALTRKYNPHRVPMSPLRLRWTWRPEEVPFPSPLQPAKTLTTHIADMARHRCEWHILVAQLLSRFVMRFPPRVGTTGLAGSAAAYPTLGTHHWHRAVQLDWPSHASGGD